MSKWSEPSPSDWDRWEQRLADGEEPATAAAAEHQTCSAFKRQDPVRHAEALAGSREARGFLADRIVDNDVIEHDEAGAPVAFRSDVSDSQKQFWARRWQPAYGNNTTVELSGPGGRPIEVEDRSATLADVLAVLHAVGATDGSPTAPDEISAA